ncbi:Ig-like domain repeat protein [uncultured Methanobrevibacter sp.]|uniref:Ig-like domain repeat protein n=1 Tax=uncultured Methanobrevibacter sp. TaxID=253161 RepID=UPI002583DA39|nr:Ig-like domain repeat protein [uncultured Methanobrevibacter sp.]
MLKSKILIISTMILFIISISAVNAENVTSSMVNDTVNDEFHITVGKNLNATSNVLYDGKYGSVLENKNSKNVFFKYGGNNTVVSKEKPKMNVIAEDSIIFGENLTVKVELPKDANPSWVLMSVGEIYYYVKIDDEGVSLWNMTDLEAGIQYIKIGYRGNNKYEAVEVFHTVNVIKANPNLNVFIKDVNYGENLTIYATLKGVNNTNLTGNVIVTINNKNYSVVVINGKGNVSADKLPVGLYNFSATWAGNDNYNETDISGGFKVNKIDPALVVDVKDIKVGENATISVNLDSDATGNVTIMLDNQNYTVAINEGQAIKVIGGLKVGDYNVAVKYGGDNNYNAVNVNATFTVSIMVPTMDVIVNNITFGQNLTVDVILPKEASGNVTITIDNKDYISVVKNGKASQVISNLSSDNYTLLVKYGGNKEYASVNSTKNINVAKASPKLEVAIKNVDYGENLIIEVILNGANNDKLTGMVDVTINNKNYTVGVVNGRGIAIGDKLPAGVYNFSATWSGNDNYNGTNTSGSFKVNKIAPRIDVLVNDIVFGQNAIVNIVLPEDVNDNVIFSVDDVEKTLVIVNGKANYAVKDLDSGNHMIMVKYEGSDKYTSVNATKNIKVAKANASLNVIVNDVDYGNVYVIDTVLTGVNNAKLTENIFVTINNKNYTVEVVNGKGTLLGDKLGAGVYNFSAIWDGNDNYNLTADSGKFKINKINSTVSVGADDIRVGENVTVTVSLASDTTGNVIISVDNQVYNVAIENGSVVKTISDFKAGIYDVFVKYIGDDNYNSAQNTTKFTVLKISDYNMDVAVPEAKEGVNSTVVVDLPEDATGTVTVEIDGENYTANVTKGTAKVNIPGLGVGEYNITTIYSGNAKYVSMTKKGNITVIPNVDVNLYVDDVVMIYHDGTRLVAKLTDYQGKPIVNASVYFTINGKTYAKTTDDNGAASIGLNLDSKVYIATVSYNESEVYSKISKNVTVTINPTIISEDLVKMYQNDTRFYVKFTDSTGKALDNTTVKFNINGVFYTKKIGKDGVADLGIMLRPGEYILTAYNSVTGEEKGFNITVKSLIVQSDLTKYYLNASKFQATIYDKNGSLAVGKNVTFNINGVFYTKTTDSNGVVSLAINLRPGEYIITTMYEGLAVGNNIVVLPTLVTSDLNMTYGDGSNFTAQTLDGQGKPLVNQNVTFNINGVFYNKVTDDNGVASLTIRLMSGKYIITSYWNDFQTGNTIIIS